MSYLKLALQALEAATDKGGQREAQTTVISEHVPDHTPFETPHFSPPEHILTCADCDFHKYQGPNPRQGWGRCTFKEKGCYGLRPACEAVLVEMYPDLKVKN